MTNAEFFGHKVWEALHERVIVAQHIQAAVAYVGANGDDLLPLTTGSQIVVDASDASLARGMTNPDVLDRWIRKGVRVRSLEGLHAKVFVLHLQGGRRQVVVGSANASYNSRDRLAEAAVVIDDDSVSEDVISQVTLWWGQGHPVNQTFVDRARLKFRHQPPGGPSYESLPIQIDRTMPCWLGAWWYPKDEYESADVVAAVRLASEAHRWVDVFALRMSLEQDDEVEVGTSLILVDLDGQDRDARDDDWVDAPALIVDIVKALDEDPVAIVARDSRLARVAYGEIRKLLDSGNPPEKADDLPVLLEGELRWKIELLWDGLNVV